MILRLTDLTKDIPKRIFCIILSIRRVIFYLVLMDRVLYSATPSVTHSLAFCRFTQKGVLFTCSCLEQLRKGKYGILLFQSGIEASLQDTVFKGGNI